MSVDYETIARHLQQTAGNVPCVVPDTAVAANIKKCFHGSARLPPIVSFPALIAAAARLPHGGDVIKTARLLEDDSHTDGYQPLRWILYEQLRQDLPTSYSSATRLRLAQKLTRLFLEIDLHLPIAANPFASTEKRSHEWEAAKILWQFLAEEDIKIGIQPIMRDLSSRLPALIAVCNENTPAPERAFYEQCNADIFELSASDKQQQLQNAFTLEGSEIPVDGYSAAMGIGATLTESAQLATDHIHRFLAETADDKTMGVIIYDRLLARHVRAGAETRKILITDHKGWRAESLAYGAALSIYADVVLGDFSAQLLGEILYPPFFKKYERLPAARKQWRFLFAQALQLPDSIKNLLQQLQSDSPHNTALAKILTDLNRTRQTLPRQPATLTDWLQRLLASSRDALWAWERDAVADAIKECLHQQAAQTPVSVDSGEFLLWLKEFLASEHIPDDSISSRVVFSYPGTQQRFDALLLLGDTGNTAAFSNSWLGEQERTLLNLPSRRQLLDEQRRVFCQLLENHQHIAAVWNSTDSAGKQTTPNPFWRLFADACHRHDKLTTLTLATPPPAPDLEDAPCANAAAIAPTVLPETLPLSAARTLMTCPYKFYINHLLGLKDEGVLEDNEISPALRGILMHGVLEKFSQKIQSAQSDDALMEHWQNLLSEQLRGNRPALNLLAARWRHYGEALISWELAQQQQGWRLAATELTIEQALPLPNGQSIRLTGRLDRMDRRESKGGVEERIIDYKSGTIPTIKKLNIGEDPQLPLYAFLSALQNQEASIVEKMLRLPLHEKTAPISINEKRVAARLRRVLRQITNGQPLPANGNLQQACQKCSAIGLCRRPYWVPAND